MSELHEAAWHGAGEWTQRLIDRGDDIEAREMGDTPLQVAAQRGHGDIVTLLLDHGADIEARDAKGLTPLQRAIIHCPLTGDAGRRTVSILTERGADVNADSLHGTVLDIACISGVEKWRALGKPEPPEPIHLADAACYGDVKTARRLLDRGVDVDARDDAGVPALMLAIENNHTEFARLLIDQGAGIEARDPPGIKGDPESMGHWRAIHYAVFYCRLEIARLLIERGADLEARESRGMTPLDMARDLVGDPPAAGGGEVNQYHRREHDRRSKMVDLLLRSRA